MVPPCHSYSLASDATDRETVDRVAFFQEVAEQNENKPLELEVIQAKIHECV